MALYYDITNVGANQLISANISHSHGASTATATIMTRGLHHSIGDAITVDLGYTTNHDVLFTGYVKSIERAIPEDVYTVVANDNLIRAADNFIVSSNPETPLTYQNIAAETLITNLMALSGLSMAEAQASSFTFGINNPFEVNQVSAYDFSSMICNLLTYHLWCDENGLIHFRNRKPFLMTGSEPQVGWADDTPIAYTWNDATKTIDINFNTNEDSLRNRVVVYGVLGVQAEAKDDSTPYFKWKTAVLGAPDLIDDTSTAQNIASYNLHLLNKLTYQISTSVVGDPILLPHRAVTVNSTILGINEDYYIFLAEHSMDKSGYITRLELRK